MREEVVKESRRERRATRERRTLLTAERIYELVNLRWDIDVGGSGVFFVVLVVVLELFDEEDMEKEEEFEEEFVLLVLYRSLLTTSLEELLASVLASLSKLSKTLLLSLSTPLPSIFTV